MRLVNCLESADIPWCAIGGVAVNHRAEEPLVTQDVDFVVATEHRQSKRIKDLGDISRLVESHPELWLELPADLQAQIERST